MVVGWLWCFKILALRGLLIVVWCRFALVGFGALVGSDDAFCGC